MKKFIGTLLAICLLLVGCAYAELPEGQKALYEGIEEVELFTGIYKCPEDFKPGGYLLKLKEGRSSTVFLFEIYDDYIKYAHTDEYKDHMIERFFIDSSQPRRIHLDAGNMFYVDAKDYVATHLYIQPEQK